MTPTLGLWMPLAILALLGSIACGRGPAPRSLPPPTITSAERLEAFQAARRDPAVSRTSRVGPGDVLRIDVVDVEEASRDYVVSRRGTIRLPFVGSMPVADETVDGIADELMRRYRSIVTDPRVDVRRVEIDAGTVEIRGAVATPGRLRLGLHGRTLSDALEVAGGLRDDAAGVIRLVPESGAPAGLFADPPAVETDAIVLAAEDLRGPGSIHLRDGDRIFVPAREGASTEELAGALPWLEETPRAPRAENSNEEPSEPSEGVEVPPSHELSPDVEDLVADVERDLDAAESTRERRAALERELEEWRARARRLEEQVRAEREEAEELRARLIVLEGRLREADEEDPASGEAARGGGTPSPAVPAAEPEKETGDDEERSHDEIVEVAEVFEDRGNSDDSWDALPVEEEVTSGGGLFGSLWGAAFGVDRDDGDVGREGVDVEAADPPPSPDTDGSGEVAEAASPAALPPPPEARITVEGEVDEPGAYDLGYVRTVSAAIESAGAAPGADLGAIEVRRPWGRTTWTIVVDLDEVRAGRRSDLLLVDGDVVVVPSLE